MKNSQEREAYKNAKTTRLSYYGETQEALDWCMQANLRKNGGCIPGITVKVSISPLSQPVSKDQLKNSKGNKKVHQKQVKLLFT